MAFFAASFLQAFCTALPLRPVSTTAADSAIRCRCGIAFRLAPCHRLSHHTPFSSHLPKVRGGVTASRAPCVRVFPAAVHFPPSEGVQNSRVFVPPSEGVRVVTASRAPCISVSPATVAFPPSEGARSHLPKVRGVATSSRAPCARVSPATMAFPPSEGVQYSLVFVSPSEGVQFQNEKAGCALS